MANKYTARSAAVVVLSDAEINGVANGVVSSLSATQVNITAGVRFPLAQVEINLAAQAANRSAGAYIAVYFVPSLDDTTFGTITGECIDNYFVGSVSVNSAALAAATLILDRVRVPVGNYKVAIKNGTGQLLAAAGNTVELRTYTNEDAA
jgi:hypothetical protein